jgi:Ribbon-helix-helix protein, copG family.
MSASNETKIVTVRMPADIYDKVKKLAGEDRRSFSGMVAILLEKAAKADA